MNRPDNDDRQTQCHHRQCGRAGANELRAGTQLSTASGAPVRSAPDRCGRVVDRRPRHSPRRAIIGDYRAGTLLGIEVAAVETRRHTGLLRFASLPAPYAIEDFDFTAQPGVDEKLIRELASRRSSTTPATSCWSVNPAPARPCSPSAWLGRQSTPGIGSTSPPRPTWPNAANAPRSRVDRDADLQRTAAARHRRVRLRPAQPGSGSEHRPVRGDQPPLPQILDHRHQPRRHRVLG